MTSGDESLKMASVESNFTASSNAVEPALGAAGALLGGMLLLWLVCFVAGLVIMYYGSKFMVEHYGVKGNMSIGVYLAFFFLSPLWWCALMIAGFQRVFGGNKGATGKKAGQLRIGQDGARPSRPMPMNRRRGIRMRRRSQM